VIGLWARAAPNTYLIKQGKMTTNGDLSSKVVPEEL
jgi:hypothetical protein